MDSLSAEQQVLILCAMPEEARAVAALLSAEAVEEADGRRLYRAPGCLLAITGPLEHRMASEAAWLILKLWQAGVTIRHLVNFGAVGAYPGGRATLGGAYLVGQSGKWDMGFPIPGYEQYLRDLPLITPHQALATADHPGGLSCLTGATFSSEELRAGRHYAQQGGFPVGDLEDMELYGLASLCATLGLPLSSVKFVTNMTDESAVTDFQVKLSEGAESALPLLEALLAAVRT